MEMNAPLGPNVLDKDSQGLVGKPFDRVDGRLKVTGGARYAYEVLQGPGTTMATLFKPRSAKGASDRSIRRRRRMLRAC